MRIIAGRFRSRKLHSPADAFTTRPIPDRVKESLFNLLRGHFEGARVVDCFAGTGSIGLEAISRGAEHCVFLERDKRACDLLDRNIQTLDCTEQSTVIRGDALGPAVLTRIAAMGGADLIFMDPPYPMVRDPGQSLGGTGGWERTKLQLERLIGTLSDKGFATIRTPWPFRHAELSKASDQPQDGAHPAGARSPGHKKRSPRIERSWVIGSGSVGDSIDLAAIEESSRKLERKMRKGDRDKPSAEELLAGRAGKRSLSNDDLGDDEDMSDFEDDGLEILGDEDEADEAVDLGPTDDPEAREKPDIVYHDVDMSVPGAVGPETHVYGSTAVHLYMRQR